jgi:biotin operon repressor
MTNVTYKYATVLVAIQNLRNEGYNVDFNLEENCLICG